MLLAIDVGNSNIVVGIFDGEKLLGDWRLRTVRKSTEDEFSLKLLGFLNQSGIDIHQISKTIISSVVPQVVGFLNNFCLKYLSHKPVFVTAQLVKGLMPILYNNPAEVGADRIVNAIAAYHKYPKSLIVIDFGTATTFDVISEKGEYLGGAISPGLIVASDALFSMTSKLPKVELFEEPRAVIGKDTAESLQSGIIFGYSGLVDGIVDRIKDELETVPKVIATGGLSGLMKNMADSIESIEPSLTLEGLLLISKAL